MIIKNDLTKGPVGRNLLFLSAPMVLGIFSLMIFNFIDTFFVARLGTEPLAAITFTFPVVFLVGGFSMGLGTAVASLVSHAIGANDTRKAKRLVTDGLILSFLIVAVFSFLGLATISAVFTLLGARGVTLDLTSQYMRIWYIGMMFLVVPMVGNNAIRASGDTRIPAIIMTVSAILNCLLDPLLIFGLWGFPRLELRGAAIATVIARGFSLCFSLYVLCRRKKMIEFSLPSLKELLASWKDILYIGIPSALTNTLIPLSSAFFTRIVAYFGIAAVAAVGAGLRIEAFSIMVIMAISSALVPFVGQNFGAGNYQRVRRARVIASEFSLFWGLFCVLLFFLSAPFLAGLFSRDRDVVKYIIRYLWIIPFSYGLQGWRMLHVSFFNALHKPLKGTILNVVWIVFLYLPLAFCGARWGGLYGLFVAVAVAHSLSGIIAFIWGGRLNIEKLCSR
jgi:putative MATE family efflux protein